MTQFSQATGYPAGGQTHELTSDHAALVDGHVHIHAPFDLGTLLDHAAQNRDRAARSLGLSPDIPGVLMLTESQGATAFLLAAKQPGRVAGRWQVQDTGENLSLRMITEGAGPLVLVAGRQIVTAERLEVLALGTLAAFVDGQPILSALDKVLNTGALAVLPWGFGKWLGVRGRIIRDLLSSPLASRLFVGDNGGRLGSAPEPSLLSLARQRGVPILPGTDPFPFPEQIRRPLGYGFVLACAPWGQTPAASIKHALESQRAQPEVFGQRTGLAEFVRNQLAMQWHKRRARAGGVQ